jgi:heme exporter protein B
LSQILAILWKDIRAELRTKDIFISMFVFVLLTLITFNFAFSGEKLRYEVVAGAMWVSYLFAAVLGLSRSLVHEKDKGCLEGLLLCPMERSAIYFGKALGNFLFLLIVEVLSLPFFSVFFTQAELLKRPLYLFISFILGSAGISAVGTLFSAITVNTKARELLLPVLLFPILLPVLIGAVKLTLFVLDPQPIYEPFRWMQLLLIYDIIFVLFSNLTFHYVVEE